VRQVGLRGIQRLSRVGSGDGGDDITEDGDESPLLTLSSAVASLPDLTSGFRTNATGGLGRSRSASRLASSGKAKKSSMRRLPGTSAVPVTQPPLQITYPPKPSSGKAKVAIDVRPDGSAVGKWPNGRIAVSVEHDPVASEDYIAETGDSNARLYRVIAHVKDGSAKTASLPCVAFDGFGAGSVSSGSGATVLTTSVCALAAVLSFILSLSCFV
jgi:hypothetical protein